MSVKFKVISIGLRCQHARIYVYVKISSVFEMHVIYNPLAMNLISLTG